MDVVYGNFEAALTSVKKHLKDAVFYSIDLEMTGIDMCMHRGAQGDLPQDRYVHLAAAAKKFSIIQFGLSIFTKSDDGYVAHPYNFYLFPEGDKDVVLNAGAIAFLKKNGMDFQKWLTQGITYVGEAGEVKMVKRYGPKDDNVKSPAMKSPKSKIVLNNPVDIKFIDDAMAEAKTWVESKKNGTADTEEFAFPQCNSYRRRVLHDRLNDFETSDSVPPLKRQTKSSDNYRLYISMPDEKRLAELKEQKEKEMAEKLLMAVGFRNVFKLLIESKLPLVGHNLFLDLLYSFNSFDSELPETFDAFRARVHELFPTIIDTKYLSEYGSANPLTQPGFRFDSTVLGDLAKACAALDNPPKVTINPDPYFSKYTNGDENYHEAGWDAHQTGLCFLSLVPLYIIDESGTVAGPGIDGINKFLEKGRPNLCCGTRTVFNWPLSPTDEPYTKASMRGGQIFYVSGFTVEDGAPAIIKPFPVGKYFVNIKWINDSAAWVEVIPKMGNTSAVDLDDLKKEIEPNIGKLIVVDWDTFVANPTAFTSVAMDTTTTPTTTTATTTNNNDANNKVSWLGWLLGSNEGESEGTQAVGETDARALKRRRVE